MTDCKNIHPLLDVFLPTRTLLYASFRLIFIKHTNFLGIPNSMRLHFTFISYIYIYTHCDLKICNYAQLQHIILSDMPNVVNSVNMVSPPLSSGSGTYELSSESVTQLRGLLRDRKNTLETMGVRLTSDISPSTFPPYRHVTS